MTQNFTPLLSTVDWNEEWKELQITRRRVDDSSYWDKRSQTFTTKDSPNSYVERFLELSGIKPNETVFDMGCGTGAISVPLGARGHKVVAADFSQGMLDKMQENLDEQGVKTVFPKLMSWEDDWEALGVREGMTDIAVASRSIATADMRDSLLRLDKVARRRVCITLSNGSSPRMDEGLLKEIGVRNAFGNDSQYAYNILVNEGIKPETAYIESERRGTYDTYEEAYADFSRMVADAFIDKDDPEIDLALKRLEEWIGAHLVDNPEVGVSDRKGLPQKALVFDKVRIVTWSFIAWNTAR